MRHKANGLGVYWCIIEMLYEQNGYIKLSDIEVIAFELHEECDRIKSVLQDFDLFRFKDDKFYSDSVLRRLKARKNISVKNKQNAIKRWKKVKCNDANALQSQSDRNAIKGKERKGNKSKENIELRNTLFVSEVWSFKDKYPDDMLKKFCDYWTEKNKSGSKMRFELQETFEISKRLATWFNKDKEFIKRDPTPMVAVFGTPGLKIEDVR
jgi:hypothetical protein